MTHARALFYIALFSLLVYANSLGGSFIGDDKAFIVANRHVQSPENIALFFIDPSASAEGALKGDVYRPLASLSYALDYAVWKLNSFGYHLTNIVFHAANGALVFILISLISGDWLIALFASLLFVSHPVQTEAVSWISGRSNVIFLFFYLASLICYILSSGGRRKGLYPASIFLFALSLFSKEMAVTLPLILFAYDIHFSKGRNITQKALRVIPYAAVALFFIIIRSSVLGKLGQFEGWGNHYHIFLTMLTVIVDYVRILIYPLKLHTANYIIPISTSIVEWRVLYSIGVLAALAAAMFFSFKRSRLISFSILWFFITLIPVLNIVPIKAFESERFLYLPSIGFCAIAASAAAFLSRKFSRPVIWKATAAVLAAAMLVGVYSVRTIIRNEDWKDEITMYRKMVTMYPLSTWTLNVLGASLLEAERYDEALGVFRKSVALEKDNAESRGALGRCYLKLERYREAAPEFDEALRLNPQNSIIRNMLGVAYINLKRYDDARKQFIIALKTNPEFLGPYLNMGRLYETKGDYKSAVKQYAGSLKYIITREETAVIYLRIGDAYLKMGRAGRAREYFAKARDLYGTAVPDVLQKILEEKEKGL